MDWKVRLILSSPRREPGWTGGVGGSRGRSSFSRVRSILLPLSWICLLVCGFVLWGGPGPAAAAAATPSGHPYDPPEKEDALRLSRRPWRETLPSLIEAYAPDLQTLPPHDLQLVLQRTSGRRQLRFSNSVWNHGPGPLELRGWQDNVSGAITVAQQIYGPDGAVVERSVEAFFFQDNHSHWHWPGFSVYEIWRVGPWGELVELVSSSDKVGFCMLDTSRISTGWLEAFSLTGMEVASRGRYGQCSWELQGISVGWVDTYAHNIPGQSMEVTGLPDSLYALRSMVDPEGRLFELDRENNSAVVYFYLEGERLEVIQEDILLYLLRRCQGSRACPAARQN